MGASQSQNSEPNLENVSVKRQNEESHVQPQNKESHVQPMEDDTPDKVLIDFDSKSRDMEKKTDKLVQLPRNYEAILKEADSPVDMSSMDKLLSQLHAGVFLNQNRKKYWVDKKSNKNCFMLCARDLSITWGEDYRFWHWSYQKETDSEVFNYVAELLQVCWLEVQAKFNVGMLSPGTLYEVALVVMLRDGAFGWEAPVNFRLTLPTGEKVERKEILMNKPKGKWIEIPVGEFATSSENVGELEIYIHEYDAGSWKRGLIVKGLAIRPKN